MNEKLRTEVLHRLARDYGLKPVGAKHLRKGLCPVCRDKGRELRTYADSPWVLICGRDEKCGARTYIKDIYSDLFNDWSEQAPATAEDPQATARAYLEFARGFRSEMLEGWYTQENFWSRELGIGSATVRFPLDKGGYWERLIDRPERFGKMKARFRPISQNNLGYKGVWWCPPTLDLMETNELWIVEGIFDAVALLHHQFDAVSMMSSSPFPDESLKELAANRRAADKPLPHLIFALDNEPRARENTRKWVKQARELGFTCGAALIPQPDRKLDWNDLHQRWQHIEPLQERTRRREEDIYRARHEGALLLAESPDEKGMLMHEWDGRREFAFGFKNRLYWFKYDSDKHDRIVRELEKSQREEDQKLNERQRDEKAMSQCGAVVRIANCYMQALYWMRNEQIDESWYYFRVDRPHGQSVKNTFTPSQLASAPEFNKRLMGIDAGAMFTGTAMQLTRFLEPQLERLKTVRTIDWVGYTREYSAYVFNDLAVQNGKVYKLNKEDFFDLADLSIKSQTHSPTLQINADLDQYDDSWFETFWQCFGVRGAIVLAWWLGCLHAEQIRQLHKSYLFLELIGEAGSGKSTLIEFCWKLCGRLEYEGFDPTKATPASRARNFSQVANLPVVLIESEREQQEGAPTKHYDWDELKTAYNGRSVRSTGVKNSGNETREPPFRAGLLVAQNNAIKASEPILQRLGHVNLTREHHTPKTKIMAEQLERMDVDKISGFILKATTREADIIKLMDTHTSDYEQQLLALPEIRTVRIAKNHAQLLSLVDCLQLVVPLNDERAAEMRAEIQDMACKRQQAINADHPTVREFWDIVGYLNGLVANVGTLDPDGHLNHARTAGTFAINLNEVAEVAALKKQQLPQMSELKRLLKTSKSPKFIDSNRAVNSQRLTNAFDKPKTVRCWVFQLA